MCQLCLCFAVPNDVPSFFSLASVSVFWPSITVHVWGGWGRARSHHAWLGLRTYARETGLNQNPKPISIPEALQAPVLRHTRLYWGHQHLCSNMTSLGLPAPLCIHVSVSLSV